MTLIIISLCLLILDLGVLIGWEIGRKHGNSNESENTYDINRYEDYDDYDN